MYANYCAPNGRVMYAAEASEVLEFDESAVTQHSPELFRLSFHPFSMGEKDELKLTTSPIGSKIRQASLNSSLSQQKR